MDIGTLETLKDDYPTASWALWSSEYPDAGCIEDDPTALYEFIKRNREKLRPSVVLLSLNPSTHLPSEYQNFHSTDPKHRNEQLRDLVEDAGLEGAYMTDLVERVEANSSEVDPSSADVDNLLEQLDLLGHERYYVICFLREVFDTLAETFDSAPRNYPHDIKGFTTVHDETEIECYRVWFHANWGANKDKIPALRRQLRYLSSDVIDGGRGGLSQWID